MFFLREMKKISFFFFFLLRNKKKISLNYPQYPLLSGALNLGTLVAQWVKCWPTD